MRYRMGRLKERIRYVQSVVMVFLWLITKTEILVVNAVIPSLEKVRVMGF